MDKLNKKTFIMIGGGVLAVVIVIVVVILLMGNKTSQEEKITNRLEEFGKIFYEKFYFPYTGTTDKEKADFVKDYEKLGIKVSLDNLSRYDLEKDKDGKTKDILKEFVNPKTKKACDTKNSRVIIYPTSPYKIDSYKIEVELVCGFDSKK